MTRKKLFFGLAVLLLGLANGYAADKDARGWRARWKVAITQWTQGPSVSEEQGAPEVCGLGAATGALIGSATGTVLDAPTPCAVDYGMPVLAAPAPIAPAPCALPPCTLPPPPVVDDCVEPAAYWVPSENVTVGVVPPVGPVGQLGDTIGRRCAEFVFKTVVSGMTLPSGRYLEQPPQYMPTPAECGRTCAPVMCGTGACLPPPIPCPAPLPCPPRPVRVPCCPLPPAFCPAMPPPAHMLCPPCVPYTVTIPVPPPPPAFPGKPVAITLVETKKGKVLEVALQDGTTIRCKKLVLTPAQDDKLSVRVVNNRLKVSGAEFTGYVDKVTIRGDGGVQFDRAPSEYQTGVICNPQLAQ